MGANQSSSGGQAQGDGAVATSYYELLGVDRHADDDEIKKAYRKKALELHPDRNFGKEEEATRLFAEIQTAYEILSDPQERAWYDSHESAILRGGQGSTEDHYEHDVRITTAEDITAMLAKFHGKINYTDAPNGFFGFLRDTFDKLAREEQLAAEWSKTDALDYPPFGHKDDTYEDVVKEFYTGWSSFSTTKSFSWKDTYRYSDATDRRMRRIMEKENKRLRDEGVREFNEAVRTLVAFVRKRDPRYTPNTQTDEERQKVMREAAKAQAVRQRAANAAKITEDVPEWTKSRDPEELEESEEEDEEQEEFECVACHKTFKSERQFEAHEKSKKHQKAVQALKKKMHKENRNLALDEDASSSGLATPSAEEDLQSGEDGAEMARQLESLDMEEQSDTVNADEDAVNDFDSDESTKIDHLGSATKRVELAEESSDDAGSDYGSRKDLEERLRLAGHPDSVSDATEQTATGKRMGKAAQKRAKKAAQQAATEQPDFKFTCVNCNAAFPSRARLFQHIKDFSHAAPVPKGAKGKGKR